MSNKQSDSPNTIVYRKEKHITPEQYMNDYKMEYKACQRTLDVDQMWIQFKIIFLSLSTLMTFITSKRLPP
jgi:hypothetical protein